MGNGPMCLQQAMGERAGRGNVHSPEGSKGSSNAEDGLRWIEELDWNPPPFGTAAEASRGWPPFPANFLQDGLKREAGN